MGLDLFVQVRVIDKKTGQIISRNRDDDYFDKKEKGFIEICWWGLRYFWELGYDLAEICNKHAKRNYKFPEEDVPIPLSALPEVYRCILHCVYDEEICLQYDEKLDILRDVDDHVWIEKASIENAKALHEWFRFIIGKNDNMQIKEEDIPNEEDRKKMKESPKNYKYEFQLFASY